MHMARLLHNRASLFWNVTNNRLLRSK